MNRSQSFRSLFLCAATLGLLGGTAFGSSGADTFYGSYGDSIGIQVPPHHGVEPKLGLNYNSAAGAGFVGVGWELSGVGEIERASKGRGAPTFTSSDIYLLNGQELVACGGGVTSPGCSRGGNYTTKLESYTKIVFTSSTNKWTLTQKDGSVMTFEPSFTYGGSTLRWGAKTVTDKNNNTATYNWWCDTSGQTCTNTPAGCDPTCVNGQSCYTDPYAGEICNPCTSCTGQTCSGNDKSCYLDTVTYGSNTVKLYRELQPNPIYFSSGKHVGEMRYRLKSVDVKVGSSRLRTYALSYSTSGSSGRSMLTNVTQYGRDASVNSSGVVTNASTASKLPPNTASYSTSTTSLISPITTIARSNSLTADKVADFNGDGRDDLLVWHYRNYTTTDAPAGTYRYVLYLANSSGGFNAPITTNARSYSTTADKIGDFNGDGKADLLVWHYRTNTTTDGPVGNYRYNLYLSDGSADGFATPVTTIARSNNTTGDHVGDFDGDGKDDLIVWHYRNYTTSDAPTGNYRYNLYKSTGSAFSAPVATNARSYSLSADKIGDFNGDGKSDLLVWHYRTTTTSDSPTSNYRYNLYQADNSADVYAAPITTIARSHSSQSDKVGDFNGDGKSDLLIWHYRNYTTTDSPTGNYRYNLYTSTGAGLAAPIATIARSHTTTADKVGDFNGDGRDDLIVWHYRNYTTTDSPAGTYRYQIYVSDGKDSMSPVTSIARSNNTSGDHVGDFNGDGKHDFMVWHYRNYTTTDSPAGTYRYQVYKSGGVAVDLMTTATSPTGGISTIGYTPSSNYANTNNPPLIQAVSSLTSNDGRGNVATTSYTYSGGLYDRMENRFLGFRYAKETAPCITGESTCPYTETWFKQDYGSASKPETIYNKDGAGKLLTSSTYTYTTNGATVPHTSVETGRWEYVYDGSGSSCSSWPCSYGRRTYLSRTFDTDGNMTKEISYGNYDVSGDELTTATWYYKNTSAFLIGFPGLVRVHKGTSTSGTKLHETRLYYDQTSSYTTAPTKGLLRKEARWLATNGSFVNTEYTYDSYGNILTSKNPLGGITSSTYDSTHRTYPITRTDPLGSVMNTTFDYVCGKPLSTTLAGGRTVTMTYDNLCREVGSTSPGGSYSTHTYVNLGNPATQYIQILTPGGDGTTTWARQYFDGFGRTWRNEAEGPSSSQNIREDVTFDKRGNIWKRSAPYYANATPKWITASFDARDRVTRVTNPDNTYQTTSYGVWSSTVTDELGRWTTRYFNGKGQITEQREKLGGSYVKTTYDYDDRGYPKTIVDDSGNVTSFTFDSLGRRTQVVDPDTGTTNFVYNAAGAETSRTDARGKTTTNTYDAVGRVTQRVHGSGQSGSITVSFAYGQSRSGYVNHGKLTTITDPLGTQTLDYDLPGRLVRSTRTISGSSYTFSKGYDSGGRLKWTTYPDGDTVGTSSSPLTYDASGNLKTIPGYMTTASYDASGRVTSFTLGNGVVTTRAYNANRGWLTSINTVKGATTLQNLAYTRNNAGQVTTLTSAKANEGWNYAYDDLGRLTSATNHTSSSNNQTFTYNKIGNITNNSRVGAYSYPGTGAARPHAVSSAGGVGYAYDAAGNMTSGAGRTITFDAAGRPSQVNGDTYGYDATGERIKKVEGGVTTHYLGGDYEVKGSTVTKYISIGTSRIAKKVGSTKYYLHADHLGSIQAVTNTSGVEVQRLTYRPYGQRLSTSTSHAQTRGYIGQVEDSSGLTYLNARYYDPVLCRFISADPTMPTDSSTGLNRYAYAGNDPVNQSDIDGLGLFKKIKKFFKKVKKVLKKIGQTLQKWAAAASKIPVIGGIVALVLNTVGAALQGDWATALRGAATLLIMYLTIVVSAWANAAIGMGGGFTLQGALQLGGRLAAQAAIYGTSSYLTARVQGATHAQALKAGIMGAKIGFAMEAFSSFIDATGLKGEAGTKVDNAARPVPKTKIGKAFEAARKWWSNLTREGGPVFGAKALGGGAMRGVEKVFAFVHDHVQFGAAKLFGAEALYPHGALGTDFAPNAVGGLKLFMIEWPVNIATLHLVEKAFELAGDRVEARLAARGHSTLGYLSNVTLNPFKAFSDPAEFGATMRIMRQMGL